jgi:hypothetical protein
MNSYRQGLVVVVVVVVTTTIRGHQGPDEECRYRSTFSLTSALDGGGLLTPRPGRFTPGNDPVPIS